MVTACAAASVVVSYQACQPAAGFVQAPEFTTILVAVALFVVSYMDAPALPSLRLRWFSFSSPVTRGSWLVPILDAFALYFYWILQRPRSRAGSRWTSVCAPPCHSFGCGQALRRFPYAGSLFCCKRVCSWIGARIFLRVFLIIVSGALS